MTDLRDLVVRWQRGWGVARSVAAAEDVNGGLRTLCRQLGRDVEYVAYDDTALPQLSSLVAGEDLVTWLTVPTADPSRVAADLEAAGLVVLKSSERMMTIDLRGHPRATLAGPYRLETRIEGDVVTVEVFHESGEIGARGTAGLTGTDAIADKIETQPGHRRRGLARVVMGTLAAAAVERGAADGILIASEDGRHLYTALGWTPVADVLIAATPGTTYPS